jgi:tetratricopeptide (TPR) repeat protein
MLRRVAAVVGALGFAALAASGAKAAVTVLGNGLPQSCFEAAEFGGNAKDGIAACNEALDTAALQVRDRAATYVNRGILYSRTDDANQAVNDYNEGLRMDPDLAEGYVDRGAALIMLRRYDEALQDVNKGIALGASRLQIAYYDRAIIQEALGNIRGAYEDYKKATEIAPDFALATTQLARFKVVRNHSDGT